MFAVLFCPISAPSLCRQERNFHQRVYLFSLLELISLTMEKEENYLEQEAISTTK